MSLNIQKLKITLNTNLPNNKTIEFTKDVLYHPDYNAFENIEKYPYISTKQLYPESYLSKLKYDEIVNIFFNKENFERMLLENKTSDNITDVNFISKQNIMLMLKLLFSTKYFIVNNIHQSLDIITQKDSEKSLFYNPFNTKFSYIKLNGNLYTITKTVWLNDIVNHPKYNTLMKTVREIIDTFNDKYPKSSSKLKEEKELSFELPVKFDDISYRLRSNIIPKYKFPYRESSNVELQKYINGKKNKVSRGRTTKSENVTKFYNLFEDLYERYMLNNKDISIDNKLLDVGIDNINIGYNDNYPKREIFVLLDLIEGEVNESNKKDVYCPYTNDYLGNLLNNLVYKEQSSKVLDKPRTMYSIQDKKSSVTNTPNNMNDDMSNKVENKEIMIDKDLFYTKFFNRTDNVNKKILDKVTPILLQSEDIIEFIQKTNTELYDILKKSLSTETKTNNFLNNITRINSKYNTEIQILNEKKNQPNILPNKLKDIDNNVLKYELYSHIINNVLKYEDTKPLALGGRSFKNKKRLINNVTKKNKSI